MRVNYNVQAILTNNILNRNDKNLGIMTERLSSGYKINASKDDPSGLAIAKRMNAQLKGINTAAQNTADGISIVQIAEGALAEIQEMIKRMSELAVKGATETMVDEDRLSIQVEVDQLKEEITRVAETTDFNGRKLLGGECDLKGFTSDPDVKVSYYSDETTVGEYALNITTVTADYDADGKLISVSSITYGDGFKSASHKVEDGVLIISDLDKTEIRLNLSDGFTGPVTLDLTGMGAMRLQIGANEGQILSVRIPTISLEHLGIADLEMTTSEKSDAAIDSLKQANAYISSVRSRLGAYQNRLEHTEANLDTTDENLTGAYARIMDLDMAKGMTEYTKYQILSQASISMLSQANERPQQILQLLQ